MLQFYRKAIAIFFGLIVLTALLALVCLNRVFISDALFPIKNSVIPWKFVTITDVQKGGSSSIAVHDSNVGLDYGYVLTGDVQYPHVTAVVAFGDLQNTDPSQSEHHLVDLREYSTVHFKVRCAPHNVLAFHLHTFDPKVTDRSNFSSYRISETLFSCSEGWSEVAIDLQYMNVATWWLGTYGLVISDQQYLLDKVIAFSFGASRLGPIDTPANVEIAGLALGKHDWRYAWAFAGLLALIWLAYIFWLLKQYTQSVIADVKDKLQKDLPLMAYQQLSIEPHKDREKSQILRFLATEYANPDLSLDMAINILGINRTKINEILKEELGFTFNAYLNKLRLAEAARLLSKTEDVNVKVIAFAVGYNDPSYFNKLFKNEYGCTPKTFRDIYHSEKDD